MIKKSQKRNNHAVLILLDRDGVLCDNGTRGVRNYSDFKLVPGLSSSLKKLNNDRFRLGVITNQPDISRGLLSKKNIGRMNKKLLELADEAGIKPSRFTIKVCPHTKDDMCECRKPKTGLIKKVIKQFKLNPSELRFYLVGDKLTDLQTLENYYNQTLSRLKVPRKSVTTILLKWKYGDPSKSRRLMTVGNAKIIPDFDLRDLNSAAKLIRKLEYG